MSYYFTKELNIPFDAAIAKVTEELKKEGFGILTDIDVKATLKKNWMWISALTGFWAPVIRPLRFIPSCIQKQIEASSRNRRRRTF